jgi:GcrA cell cycle regulator
LADAKSGVTNFMSWTDERIERLKAMWTNGSTASQIAEELGGVSRNAVIGKAHRLGLESRPSPVKPGEEKEKKAKAAVAPKADKPKPAAKAVPAAPASQTIPSVAPADSPREAEAPAAVVTPAGLRPATKKTDPANMQYRSVGPGGFIRQGPGDTQAPIPPAPPRRLVPAKPSSEVADKTGLLDLNDRICRWPMGHPGEPDFHFCGQQANPGYPYCVDHCGVAYQAQLPRRDRRPPPPLPFGGPRVR